MSARIGPLNLDLPLSIHESTKPVQPGVCRSHGEVILCFVHVVNSSGSDCLGLPRLPRGLGRQPGHCPVGGPPGRRKPPYPGPPRKCMERTGRGRSSLPAACARRQTVTDGSRPFRRRLFLTLPTRNGRSVQRCRPPVTTSFWLPVAAVCTDSEDLWERP